jgi:hypothetical protein
VALLAFVLGLFLLPAMVSADPPDGCPYVLVGHFLDTSISSVPIPVSVVWDEATTQYRAVTQGGELDVGEGTGTTWTAWAYGSTLSFNSLTGGGFVGSDFTDGTRFLFIDSVDWGDGWASPPTISMISYGYAAGWMFMSSFWAMRFIVQGILYGATQVFK